MVPTDWYEERYASQMRIRQFLKEAENDRLVAEVRKAAPAKNGGLWTSASGMLSRGLAFWASAFRPPQQQCC